MAKFNVRKYAERIEINTEGDVIIWWLPWDFSQSKLGNRFSGSNACTLIALLVALKCYTHDIKIYLFSDVTVGEEVIDVLADSIVEGNELHAELMEKGSLADINMTVPEAISALGHKIKSIKEWVKHAIELYLRDINKSIVYMMDMGESLYEELHQTLKEWHRNPPSRVGSDLYVILIAQNRSILMIFQSASDKVTLIDSHQHVPHGAVIAQVPMKALESLCQWYYKKLVHYAKGSPDCYELSYLYFKRSKSHPTLTDKLKGTCWT